MKILPCFLTSGPPRRRLDEDDDDLQLDATDEESAPEQPDRADGAQRRDSALMGQKALFAILILLGAVIALQTLCIALLKAPPPLQDVYTFGFSYYKLLFLLHLCAVMLVVGIVAFTTTSFPVISMTFVVCLFCSIPLIVGLRHSLTMQQAILDISFFAGWPLFLKPMFILVFLLLPAGILYFLFLQIRTGFSRQQPSYAFAGAALFLAIATLLGSYEISRAGKPATQAAVPFQQQTDPVAPDGAPVQPGGTETGTTLPSAVVKARQQPDQKGQGPNTPLDDAAGQGGADPSGTRTATPPDPVVQASPAAAMADRAALESIEHKLGTLIDSLNTKVSSLTLLQAKAEEKRQMELNALSGRVGMLAGKLDAILLQLENKAQDQKQPPDKATTPAVAAPGPATTEGIPAAPKTDKALGNVSKQIDTLIEKVQSIETKTRDVP